MKAQQVPRKIGLKDRLSRLDFAGACRLLGAQGESLIRAGGVYEIDMDAVQLSEERLQVEFLDARVDIQLDGSARQRIGWKCSACRNVCEHVGAVFSLILEEKTALGLAAVPILRTPWELLTEEQQVERALKERQERARSESMVLKATAPGKPWSDYTVTSLLSGKTYRVALRGWERGESYCSCPDFRKSTLGTCKHILFALGDLKKLFSVADLKRPYVRQGVSVVLHYGETLELRILLPTAPSPEVEVLAGRFHGEPINDIPSLMFTIRRLQALGADVTVYPDAEDYIDQKLLEERLARRATQIRENPVNHPLRRQLLKAELLPYQMDGVAFAVGARRAVLADDMGLGKTIQGIGVAALLAREAGIRKVLVICPATLKSQWRSEIKRFSDFDSQVILGSASERAGQYASDCFFTICNYEQVLRDIVTIERVNWDLIILDEGQRIKNWEAKTSRVIKGLRSRFALVLSGTPLENRLEDLYSVVEFIEERLLGPAFRFLKKHRVVDEKGKVLGYRNLGELRRKLNPVLLRRTRESVMQELPARMTEVIRVAPTAKQADVHDGNYRIVGQIVRKPYLTEMDLLRLRKALLMCRMAADSTFLVDHQPPGFSSKLEALDDLLGQLSQEPQRKILIFSEWTTMLDLIEGLLENHGLRYVRLDGSVPQKQRAPLVARFQEDRECRVFITTNAGATGLNLQAADTVINVDLPWNPAVLEQRIARAHRMGQKRPVQVYLMVTEGTIEENLLVTLSAKRQLSMAALDASSDLETVDLESGYEELRQRLELLLGAKPERAPDREEQRAKEEEAERLERRKRVGAAGGNLLTAAFQFLAELIPPAPDDGHRQMAEAFRAQFAECLRTEENGELTFTVTLPDRAALDRLADSLAGLVAPPASPPPPQA
jgi:superfamily II DNA or RNA helicase